MRRASREMRAGSCTTKEDRRGRESRPAAVDGEPPQDDQDDGPDCDERPEDGPLHNREQNPIEGRAMVVVGGACHIHAVVSKLCDEVRNTVEATHCVEALRKFYTLSF